ncbi:MAG TPA: TlpA disulfide reductase family protein [Anaerolineales bacterium]|nr:TlpA disulfide reductase family protein [Anaerolineales bacterium]
MPALMDFPLTSLTDQLDTPIQVENLIGSIILLNFWSTECPSCEQTDRELVDVKRSFPTLVMIAILSNQNENSSRARELFRQRGYDHLWIDQGAQFAHLWEAMITPTAMIFNESGQLRYWGAINDQTFRKKKSEVNYIYSTLVNMKKGLEADPNRTHPYGCVIVDTQPV